MACTSSRSIVLEPSAAPLRSYSTLEIMNCACNPKEEAAIKVANEFSGQVFEKIAAYNKANPRAPLFANVTRSTDQTEGVLQLQSTVLGYEKGSQAARYLIGFGAGKASCVVQCSFINKSTNKQVLKAQFEGELSMGLFGGSSQQAPNKVIDELVKFLKKNY